MTKRIVLQTKYSVKVIVLDLVHKIGHVVIYCRRRGRLLEVVVQRRCQLNLRPRGGAGQILEGHQDMTSMVA